MSTCTPLHVCQNTPVEPAFPVGRRNTHPLQRSKILRLDFAGHGQRLSLLCHSADFHIDYVKEQWAGVKSFHPAHAFNRLYYRDAGPHATEKWAKTVNFCRNSSDMEKRSSESLHLPRRVFQRTSQFLIICVGQFDEVNRARIWEARPTRLSGQMRKDS